MGNLSNLYISQSFVSLIHLGSDSSITTQSVELQDGLGNGLGVFVNALGDVVIEGQISASNIPAEIASLPQFNAYTASTNTRLNNIESTTASLNSSVTQLNASSASQQVSINALNTYTASFSTASIATSITNLNSFTSSANVRLNNLETTSASVNVSISNLNITSASVNTSITNLNASTASQQISINSLNSKTGSYATTGSNTFTGAQNIVGAVTASTARIANLNYPTTDGIFTGQVMQTDAAGTLSFGNVNAVFETIHNGEATTITVGTPLYVSGALGSNPIVYRADATNPVKMPATFVAMESIASNQNGRGITLGLITGINMTGYPVGTALYVDGLGQLISTRPTGSNDIIQPIGIVTKTGTGGQLNVLNPGPVLMPNMQTGYTFVGDATNQPVLVATSSFGSNVNTGSLMVTGSVNVNVLTFTKGDGSTFSLTVASSGSVVPGTISGSAQITALGFVSSSVTASSLITASFNNGTRNLTFTKGDNTTFAVNIPDVSGSTFDTGSLVTTASFNAYTSSTNIRLSNIELTTASLNTSVTNLNIFTASQSTASIVTSITNLNTFTQSANVRLNNLELTSASLLVETANLELFSASALVSISNLNQSSASQQVSINSLNAKTGSYITTGSASTGSQTILGDFNFDTTYTANQPVVNQAGGTNVLGIDFGAFNDLITYWGNLNFAGVLVNGTGVTNASITSYNFGSYLECTLSSGTTTNGATYTLSGPYIQDISLTGSLQSTYEIRAKDTATGQRAVMDVRGFYAQNANQLVQAGASTDGGVYAGENVSYNYIRLAATSSQVSNNNGPTPFNTPQIAVSQNGQGDFTQISFQGNSNYTDGTITVHQPLFVSASLNVTGSFTASLANGFAWVGNSSNRAVAVATSSFAGSGGAGFPFTGSAVITGSLAVTGSFRGFTNTLTVAASTASINMNDGNFFRLTLPTGSTTHVTVSNLSAGQTINLLVSQSLAATGSIAFAPNIRFAGGIDYTATAITGAMDIVSFVSFDTNQIFATQVKNLS